MAPAVTYRGSRLMADPLAFEWNIVPTEWAALVAANTLYQARAGFICWISPMLQEDVRCLASGVSFLTHHTTQRTSLQCCRRSA